MRATSAIYTPIPTSKMPPKAVHSYRDYTETIVTLTKTKTLSRKRSSGNKQPTSPRAWKLHTAANGVGFLQVPAFSAFPWLIHAFSTSKGGVSTLNGSKVLNLGFTDWD